MEALSDTEMVAYLVGMIWMILSCFFWTRRGSNKQRRKTDR